MNKSILARMGLMMSALCVCVTQAAAAETYPARPLRLVVPTGAGGFTDVLSRVVAQHLGESLGQRVVVDNRPGAGSIVGSEIVAKSPPDGYTMMMAFTPHSINSSLYPKLPYDALKDFSPVTMVAAVTLVLTAHPSLPTKNIRELIALAKQRPGQINYGSVGSGSLGHLGAELFKSLGRVSITHVPYKGAPQANSALLSGEVSMFFDTPPSSLPLIKAGRVRALGVSTRKRLALLPDVPAIAEVVPGYEVIGWNGIVVPAGTPQSIIDRLHTEIAKVLRTPSVSTQLTSQGIDPVGDSPAQFSAFIKSDTEKWARVIREAGIKPD